LIVYTDKQFIVDHLIMDQFLAIRVYARVVEAGSFTKAADSLKMPKATVTKLVQGLEAHLRVKLLQRTTRSLSVTAEGAAYYEQTARLMRELEDIDTSFGTAQNAPRGHLRIDIGASTASRIVIPALPEFHALYPDIRLDLGVSDRHVDLIGENVDCVIRGGELTDLSLVARRIGAAAWVTCATPDYLERHGAPLHPSALEDDHQLVHYVSARSGRVMPFHFEQDGRQIDIQGGDHHIVRINESNAHFAAGLAGLGLMQTFSYQAGEAIARGQLVAVLTDWQPPAYPFYVVYPPTRHPSNRLRVFIDWIATRFADLAEERKLN
jgi:LysR family transcriptional regulator for bpeEF and oprC